MSNVEEDLYTKDGTLDYNGNPAIRAQTGTWKACPYILVNECCERLAYEGLVSNIINYLTNPLNKDISTAAIAVNNWSGTCYLTPLFGAFIADAYLGRFWTIVVSMLIYSCGLLLLTLSASVPALKPYCSDGVCNPSSSELRIFFLSLYMIALGTGGIKPCVSSFGADQFDDNDEAEKKNKNSFFNWFYFTINIGALIAHSVLVWIQMNVGWEWGFGIPMVAMLISISFFIFGAKLYRNQKPAGSPLTRIAQVLVASFRNIRVKVPEDKSLLYEIIDRSNINGSSKLEHTNQFSFFDKAAVVPENIDNLMQEFIGSPWKMCTVTQVEEFKAVIRLFSIWATTIIFSIMYCQMTTMFVLQGNKLDHSMGKSFKIESASLSIFDILSIMIWVPIYARLIVPVARRITGNERGFTPLIRIGIGLGISTLSMIAAGILEMVRLNTVKKNNELYGPNNNIPAFSIFWQVPPYFIMGAAEVFTLVGQLEFFYMEAPDSMKSICSAIQLTTMAIGNYMSTFLVIIVKKITEKNGEPGWIPHDLDDGKLHYFYFLLALLGLIDILIFIKIARRYQYKKTNGLLLVLHQSDQP
ncbi:putative peptide transporter, Protein NRT1/ PTR FAMILY 8.8 [Zostera marina]|uniref:Putative peptide transporter, Protein NRT1/ PTR FAMILY 8.8 n=1 Tax=Zostera marina TaxID=29655 RepID=A0A0K9Q4H7_ZOSMR|nr:putative peptide transporter, Protein NRT1/ PTR FAMILY 8.8 [Zostera marina]